MFLDVSSLLLSRATSADRSSNRAYLIEFVCASRSLLRWPRLHPDAEIKHRCLESQIGWFPELCLQHWPSVTPAAFSPKCAPKSRQSNFCGWQHAASFYNHDFWKKKTQSRLHNSLQSLHQVPLSDLIPDSSGAVSHDSFWEKTLPISRKQHI